MKSISLLIACVLVLSIESYTWTTKKKRASASPKILALGNASNIDLNKLDKKGKEAIINKSAFAIPKLKEVVEQSRTVEFSSDQQLQQLRDESFRVIASTLLAVARVHLHLEDEDD